MTHPPFWTRPSRARGTHSGIAELRRTPSPPSPVDPRDPPATQGTHDDDDDDDDEKVKGGIEPSVLKKMTRVYGRKTTTKYFA